MKTAIYIEDGIVQLIITPESEFEKDSLKMFREKTLQAKVFSGSFYDCRGGWVRQTAYHSGGPYYDNSDKSLIISVKEGGEDESTNRQAT